jgi:hypothetical protein
MIETSKGRVERAQNAIGKIKAQREIAAHKRTWNVNTSLKSYIDPRVYYRWGREVEYDVIERYYPKALRRKFAWVKTEGEPSQVSEDGGPIDASALTAGAPVDLAQDVALQVEKVPETAALVSGSAVPHTGLKGGADQ